MCSKFNLEHFPYVFIEFNKDLKKDEDFFDFTTQWLQLYELRKPFVLIFNTIPLKDVSIKYCFYMSVFIQKIRNIPTQYLQKSYIIVEHKYILHLLEMVFYLQPPVADVYIIDTIIEKQTLTSIESQIEHIHIIKKIHTSRPFLPFL